MLHSDVLYYTEVEFSVGMSFRARSNLDYESRLLFSKMLKNNENFVFFLKYKETHFHLYFSNSGRPHRGILEKSRK